MTAQSKPRRKLNIQFFKYNYLTLKGIFILIMLLSILQLYVSNRFVTEGEKIKQAQDQAKLVKSENLSLEDKIQELSSLSYLEKQAIDLGFVKVNKVEYLISPAVIASR